VSAQRARPRHVSRPASPADALAERVESKRAAQGAPSRHRMTLDIVSDAPPAADLIFIRDCFIHVSNDLAFQSPENGARNNIRYRCVSSASPACPPMRSMSIWIAPGAA
jgi:hypothetical protein